MPSRIRLEIVVFMLIRVLTNTMHRMVYPLLPAFARGLGVDIETFALALTARSTVGAASPLFAALTDSRGRKTGMVFGMVLFLIGVGVVVVWPSFPVFVAALILTTIGKYVIDPSIHAYLGDQVPYARRGLTAALVEMGWSLSFIVGVPLAGFLIARWGWLAPFPLFSVLALLSIGVLAWWLPDSAGETLSTPHIFYNISRIFRYLPAVAGLMVGAWMSAANETVNLVFGVWLEDAFGLRLTALGAASMLIGISEFFGESIVGWITDRVGKPRAIAGGLVLNSLAALALPRLGTTLTGAFIGLFLFYVTFEFSLVSSIPLMTEIMPAQRATLLAVYAAGLSLGRALAASFATWLFAWGIGASVLAAVGFNFLAGVALRKAKIP